MPIKLTKKLPTEDGWYYWCNKKGDEVIVERVMDLEVECPTGGYSSVHRLGGYWAKLDQSMFEVVDDEPNP